MIARTDTSMLSPIMMLWFDLRVSTSIQPPCFPRLRPGRGRLSRPGWSTSRVEHRHPFTKRIRSTKERPCLYYSPDPMPRRSLRPELNRIRAWVRQGRTDAWIAHQLEVTVQQIQAFKRDQQLEATSEEAEGNGTAPDFDDEIDLRAEDDALIAAELDAAEAEAEADD